MNDTPLFCLTVDIFGAAPAGRPRDSEDLGEDIDLLWETGLSKAQLFERAWPIVVSALLHRRKQGGVLAIRVEPDRDDFDSIGAPGQEWDVEDKPDVELTISERLRVAIEQITPETLATIRIGDFRDGQLFHP